LAERARSLIWPAALVLAFAFLAVDTAQRLDTIAAVSSFRPGGAPLPARDDVSASGFEAGQRRVVLPAVGTDGYHWIMQTERMLAGGGLRGRETAVDNAPYGREVHWSSPLRWWLGGLATVRSLARPGLTPPQALEQVATWAGTVLVALLVLALAPVLAARFGAGAAALFALAWVAVFPLYETFMAGIVDHHGLVTLSCFAAILLVAAGGAGWVRDDVAAGGPGDAGLRGWLRDARSARRWFIAAGIAGGIGMWLSAITLIPVIAAIGAGAIFAAVVAHAGRAAGAAGTVLHGPAPPPGAGRPWRLEPGLWRVWGAAGCATSLAAYLLEYFPAYLGLRLEVNHPLYALAWLGAGDLLARLTGWLAEPAATPPQTPAGMPAAPDGSAFLRPHRRWLLADVLLMAAAPAVMIATGATTFRLADPFLRALHHEWIMEFQGLASHLAGASLLQVLQSATLLPLLLLPVAARIARPAPAGLPGAHRLGWQVLPAAMVLAGAAFIHVATLSSARTALHGAGLMPAGTVAAWIAVHATAAAVAAVVSGLLLLVQLRRQRSALRPPELGLLAVTAAPAVVALSLAFLQVRWLGTAAAALLVLLLITGALHAGPLRRRSGRRPDAMHHGRAPPDSAPTGAARPRRACTALAAAFVVLVLAPFPVLTALVPWRSGYAAAAEAPQVVLREVAYLLRAHHGTGDIIVAAPPTATTWLVFFGGFRGVGTLYWENADGLRATTRIFAAPSAEEAGRVIYQRGVTHLVIPSWETDVAGYGFLHALAAAAALPDWLTPVPFTMPDIPALHGAGIRVYEVARPHTP
jgi:hypothetical protein